jgi:hypothetical protein
MDRRVYDFFVSAGMVTMAVVSFVNDSWIGRGSGEG